MCRDHRRWIAVGVLAVLVVSAGCSGLPADQRTTADGPPSTAGTDAPTVADASTTGDVSTATPSAEPSERSVAEPPLDPSALQESHAAHLRERGSFTVLANTTVSSDGVNLSQHRIGRYDLDDGTALVVDDPLRGGSSRTYLAPNGSAYERRQAGDDVRYFGPGLVQSPNVTNALQFGASVPLEEMPLRYEGHAAFDGVEGHVYTSTDDAAFAAAAEGFDESEIVAVELGLVVAEAGYVKHHSVELTVEADEARQSFRIVRRYVEVGSTDVSEPDWLDEAVAATNTPDPTERVTRSFDLSNDDGSVNQSVTASRADLEWTADVGPELTGSYEFSYPLMDEAHVGPIVRLRWPEGADRVEATYHYDEDDVPRANESALTVTVYDRDEQMLLPAGDVDGVSATVDPEADTVTVVVTGETALERYRGNAFIAMDFEYFVENVPAG